jgi:hypothetical protein
MSAQPSRISRHLLIMILCCLIPVAALAAIVLLRIPMSQALVLGLILLCPLSHVLMMALMPGHQGRDGQVTAEGAANTSTGEPKASCH